MARYQPRRPTPWRRSTSRRGIKWEAQALGTTSRENAVNSVPNALLTYVGRFLEDYQAANRR